MIDIAQRVDALEMRVAHQDNMIAELNEVITAQWKRIDSLERQLQRLRDEVAAMDASSEIPVQKPPHY